VNKRSLEWPRLESNTKEHVFKSGSVLDVAWKNISSSDDKTLSAVLINTFCTEGGDSLPDAARLAALIGDCCDAVDVTKREF
jgi:hypothetical protein